MNGNFSVRPGFNLIITDVIRTVPFYNRKRNYWDNNMQACFRCSDSRNSKWAGETARMWHREWKRRFVLSAFSSSSLFLFSLSAHDFVPHERPGGGGGGPPYCQLNGGGARGGGGGGHSYDHMKGAGMLIVSLTKFWDFGILGFWPH